MPKKVLLLGASGLLGAEIYLHLKDVFDLLPTIHKSTTDKKIVSLDITKIDQFENVIASYNPDVVINCAAFTNVDQAEVSKEEAHDVNVKGVENIIRSITKETKIIHISSDYVFDGEKGNYKEEDPTFPINYYGKTKLEAENILIGSNKESLIFRLNVLYTKNLLKANFFSWVYNSLKKNTKIKVVVDQISNPVYIPDFIKILIDAILLNHSGIYHFGSSDSLSRYDFALKISECFSFNSNLVIPIKSKNLNQLARRPVNSYLNCDKIKSDFNIDIFSNEYNLQRVFTNK